VSWRAIGQGLAAGVGVTLALALLPLLAVRRVSPLLALRSTIEPVRRAGAAWRDPATLGVIAIALAAITFFAVQQATRWYFGVWFVAATVIVFGVLALVGFILMRVVRFAAPAGAPYVWRQGLANLFRPNNRTLLLILALGLGTFLVVTMALTQRMLVGELDLAQADGRPNDILFDIQSDQRAGVRATIEENGMSVLEEAPIVTMRIASIKGRPVSELRRPPDREARRDDERRADERRIPSWALTREYRSTFRSELGSAEKVIAGKFVPSVPRGTKVIPISLEKGIAEELQVGLGDAMTFDLQGVTIECEVASLREVEWRRLQPNFFVVFPTGAIDDAPQFIVMATRAENDAQSAQLQRATFEKFPNVSVIDLSLILQAIDRVMEKAGFVFRFMAVFMIGTGLIVLAGVMASGRFQRMRESVLLRTIGAARGQIARIQLVEYLLLGTLASLTGVLLAWCASWALGKWIFENTGLPAIAPMFIAWAVVSALTVLMGALSGRRLLNHPPLEVLRQET
jgi:putative ABC transport system permease protein